MVIVYFGILNVEHWNFFNRSFVDAVGVDTLRRPYLTSIALVMCLRSSDNDSATLCGRRILGLTLQVNVLYWCTVYSPAVHLSSYLFY